MPRISFSARMSAPRSPYMRVRCAEAATSPVEMTQELRVKLATLGFVDEEENVDALKKAGGDVDKALKILKGAAADSWNEERRDIDVLMEKGG
eukprot:CAMPEP_0167803128 /NCGR_PEP_ID=MMETSP0111_2-20121227/19592_1 /TAXON_ID=91324 /ORGANISM="Lotharella globosa, Strain CCCM811" /LENGTH=92 /DNA_ID=CAMNT_0007699419 /DNA_START=151 /DNA_END=429 /DNA_ORIENTATION=+